MNHHLQADARALPLRDGCAQLVVTSPPYADARKKQYGGVHPDRYVEWFLPIGAEIRRVLAPTGSFVLNIKEKVVDGERHPYVHDLIRAMRGIGLRWVETYVWHKKNAAPGYWPNRFRDSWEHCIHFTRSKRFYMDQNAVRVPAGNWQTKRLARESRNDGIRRESRTGTNFGYRTNNWQGKTLALPTNVLYLAPEARNVGHPAAFPIDLPRFFIKLFTSPGDLVLDPFSGAGTTALAAMELGRDAVMVERKAEYIDNARRRQANHKPRAARRVRAVKAAPASPSLFEDAAA